MGLEQANIDFIGRDGGQGEVANQLQINGRLDVGMMRPIYDPVKKKTYVSIYAGGNPSDPKSYRTQELNVNATLRRDEWKQLDDAVIGIAESRLNGVQDLIDKGLTYNLGNAMGTTVLEHHTAGDALSAELTMDGISRAENDRIEFTTHYLPIPILHSDYELNLRELDASRKLGNPLSTYMAERAARKVSEKLEQMLFTAESYTFGGGTIFGYPNYPHREQVTLDSKWDNSGTTAANIIADVQTLKQTLIDIHFYGQYMLYVPTSYETVLDEDYDTSGQSTQTIRERIMKIGNIQGIKVVDTLTADNVLLVQMTSDVVRLVRGMGLQNVEWKTEGNFVNKYKVLTIQVPQIRCDDNSKTGIAHATFTA